MTKSMTLADTKIMTELFGKTEEHLHYLTDKIAIHKDMLIAYEALSMAAKQAGIELKIASGYRSFDRQLMIWNNKFSGNSIIKDNHGQNINRSNLSDEEVMHAILLFSALPGASRHHWGCDIDVYASNLLTDDYQLQLEPWEYSAQGPLAKLSHWLNEHAHQFGFYFPYASYKGGIAAEPWHLSYAPLAQQYQCQLFSNEKIEQLAQCLAKSQIMGKEIILSSLNDIIKRYITNTNDIPKNCCVPAVT